LPSSSSAPAAARRSFLYASSRFGMTAAGVGAMLSVIAAINMIVLYPTGALSDRFGRKRAIAPGLLLMAVAFVQMAVAPSHLAFLAGAAVLGLGSGVGGPAPAAYMADLGPPARMGAALGVYRAIGDLGFLTGPIALGWVADAAGYGSALMAGAGLLVAAVLPFAFFARERRDRWAMA
jgi:MFS transporter, DHA1 family, multidrug resistance protein